MAGHIALTIKQVSNFRPLPGESATITFASGAEFFGDVNADRVPHGHGVLVNKADGSRFGGQWRNGKHHGPGVLLTRQFEYEGDFEDGAIHGRGTMRYKESAAGLVARGAAALGGDSGPAPLEYRGEFDKEHGRHGKGSMLYRDDSAYEGEWVNDRRHGKGKFRSGAGDTFDGDWKEDAKQGLGKQRLASGIQYEGAFAKNKRAGDGKMTFPNGDLYVGTFEDGDIRGYGAMRYRNGDTYDGHWRSGVRHGEGRFYLSKRQTTIEGTFADGLLHGEGTMHFAVRGDLFQGRFNRGERKNGTMWFSTGAVYSGEWRGESMHGRGLLWYADGSFYAGAFSASLRQGRGNLAYADGCEYSGDFVQDVRHGSGALRMPDGRIAVGTWSRGCRLVTGYIGEWDGSSVISGVGRALYDDGSIYEGMWKAGQRDGFGVLAVRGRADGAAAAGSKRPSKGAMKLAASAMKGGSTSAAAAAAAAADSEGFGELVCPHHDDVKTATAIAPADAPKSGTTTPGAATGPSTPTAANATAASSGLPAFIPEPPARPPAGAGESEPSSVAEDDDDNDIESPKLATLRGQDAITLPLAVASERRPCVFPRVTKLHDHARMHPDRSGAVEALFADRRSDETPDGWVTVLEYKGLWSQDRPAGEGTLRFVEDGAVYQGQFAFGQRCGRGVMVLPSGQIYAGQWEGDVPCGDGAFFESEHDNPIFVTADGRIVNRASVSEQHAAADASGAESGAVVASSSSAGLTTAAIGAFSWIASKAKVLVPGPAGSRRGSTVHAAATEAAETAGDDDDEQAAAPALVGYAASYATTGAWRKGCLSMTNTLFFADGRITQLLYRGGKPVVEFPHRGRMHRPDGGASGAVGCTFCKQAFTWRRTAQACRLCTRLSCSSCLNDTPLQVNVQLPSAAAAAAASGTTSTPPPQSADDIDTAVGTTVKACVDCINAVKLQVTHITLWQPVKLRPVRLDVDAIREAAAAFPAQVAALMRRLPPQVVLQQLGETTGQPSAESNGGGVESLDDDAIDDAESAAAVAGAERAFALLPLTPPTSRGTPRHSPAQFPNGALPPAELESVGLDGSKPVLPPRAAAADNDDDDDEEECLVTYRGHIAGDQPHGAGTLWFGNAACYDGEFMQGQRHGFGVLTFRNGEEFIGHWSNDNRHGHGACRLRDGTFVSGHWREDKLVTLEYHGACDSNNRRSGLGYSYDADTAQRYNGEWLNGKRHGTGTLEYADGRVYRGEFRGDVATGRGKQMSMEGSYVGDFKRGVPHGSGEARQGSSCLTGDFRVGQPHGVIVHRDLITGHVTRLLYARGSPYEAAFVQGLRQADAAATACNGCKTAFGFFFRRHHCRMCGLVFCDTCTPRRSLLPRHFVDWNKPKGGDGSYPAVDRQTHYRTCVRCCDLLSEGCAIGSKYFKGTAASVEYHGALCPQTLEPKGRGFFIVTKTGTQHFTAEAEAFDTDALHHAPAGGEGDEKQELTDDERHGIEGVKRWWQDVVARADLHDDELPTDAFEGSSPVVVVATSASASDGGGASFEQQPGTPAKWPAATSEPLTMLTRRAASDFAPANQDLGFEVAVFLDPALRESDNEDDDDSSTSAAASSHDDGAAEEAAEDASPIGRNLRLSTLQRPADHRRRQDGAAGRRNGFVPAEMPRAPSAPSVNIERPPVPVEPSHAEISECIAAARAASGDRLGLPSLASMKATHICPAAPPKPEERQPYNAAWNAWSTTAGPRPPTTTAAATATPPPAASGSNAAGATSDGGAPLKVDVLGGLAAGGLFPDPAAPPVLTTKLAEIEVGFQVAVERQAATCDLVGVTARVYPRGSTVHPPPAPVSTDVAVGELEAPGEEAAACESSVQDGIHVDPSSTGPVEGGPTSAGGAGLGGEGGGLSAPIADAADDVAVEEHVDPAAAVTE